MRRVWTRAVSLFASPLAVGVAGAHAGHATHQQRGPLPLALLLSGCLIFGAGLYLAARDDVERTYALTGVGVGLAVLVVALLLYLRQGL